MSRGIGAFLRPFDIAGYLAVWPALYLLAAACLLADSAGLPRPTGAASVMIVSMAVSVYLIDRVKLADRFRDPGDADTHPDRHAWLWAHRHIARTLAGCAFVAASVAGFMLHPLLAAAPLLGQAAVFAYSGVPPRGPGRFARVKDIPLAKNLAAALGIVTLSALSIRHMADPPHLIGVINPLGVVTLLIVADCMMCDVADTPGDRRHWTLTIPVLLGAPAGRLIASALGVAAGAWLWILSDRTVPLWPAGIIASQVVLALVPARFVRNATDLRLPVLVALVTLASAAGWGGT